MILTFDDGPGESTPELLDLLARHGLHATFFVLGAAVLERPALLRRACAEGHTVGNHSWDHPILSELPRDEQRSQLTRTSRAIEQITGTMPNVFRPPYGATSPQLEREAAELGMRTVLWDLDTQDWSRPGPRAICEALLSAGPDEVVLMHDGRRAGRQTVDGLALALSGRPCGA